MLSPAERHHRARKAALSMHAQGKTSTAAATAAFLDRFERQVDPDMNLTPDERARRAELARKAYMAGLAFKAAKARRQRASRTSSTPEP